MHPLSPPTLVLLRQPILWVTYSDKRFEEMQRQLDETSKHDALINIKVTVSKFWKYFYQESADMMLK